MTERTGVVGFTLFARGNVNDTAFPCWGGVNGTENFCAEVLDTTPGELSRKFDAWAIARSEGESSSIMFINLKYCGTENVMSDDDKSSRLRKVQAECARIIVKGLSTHTVVDTLCQLTPCHRGKNQQTRRSNVIQ